MSAEGDFERLLRFLPEPVFIMELSGEVWRTNAAATRLLGWDATGTNLAAMAEPSPDAFMNYLRRCSGSGSPIVGGFSIRQADGSTISFRTHGALLSPASAERASRLVMRCMPTDAREFSVLARKIKDLNTEIRERRRVQFILQETIHEKEILLRELHHRVKNNIQMLLGMFSAARREARGDELRTFVTSAIQRLVAIGAVQQLMYQSERMETISARPFLKNLCQAIGETLRPGIWISVQSIDVELSNDAAFPIALILNELIANAAKYGVGEDGGAIDVELRRWEPDFELIVHDNGPSFRDEGPGRRSSGLGLVKGLCRQLGSSLKIENANGASCVVRFPDRLVSASVQ